jgi:hypothetical protein
MGRACLYWLRGLGLHRNGHGPYVLKSGHEVVALDSDLYEGCTFAAGGAITKVPHIRKEVRDADARDVDGFEAVIT